VEALEPVPDDVVIEIGPGRGTLTRRLAPRVRRVIAIEKDPRLADGLSRADVQGATYSAQRGAPAAWPDNVTVVKGDALEVGWHELLPAPPLHVARGPLPVFKVVGNIPYYITTPLIEKALSPPLPRLVVFLVQKEVADRLAAEPGSKAFGALSAGVQSVAAVERLFSVRKGAFRPPPRVDSSAVRLRPLPQPLVQPQEHPSWRRFLTGLFSQRRKQLGRGLRSLTGWEKDVVEATLRGLNVDPASRPEMLRPQQLVMLFRAVAR